MNSLFFRLVFMLVLVVFASGIAKADTRALQFSGGSPSLPIQNQLWGWEFNTSAPIILTSLGVWDYNSDGLGVAHDVGIFRASDRSLLKSATIPSGTAATLMNGFRYVDIAPFELAAGTYFIMTTVGNMTFRLEDGYVFGHCRWTNPAAVTTQLFGAGSWNSSIAVSTLASLPGMAVRLHLLLNAAADKTSISGQLVWEESTIAPPFPTTDYSGTLTGIRRR